MSPEDRNPLPVELHGVWQRSLLDGPGMVPDTESTVLWLQTRRWHADLRLPPHRPDFSGCTGLAGCTPGQLAWLASQQGFAGITTVDPGAPPQHPMLCQWHRQLDFQPPRGRRDIGTLVFSVDGSGLEERGVDAEYRELWQRLPQSQGPTSAWRSTGPGPTTLLLVAGAFFFHVRDRPVALPRTPVAQPPSLADLLTASPQDAVPLLDLELSFGRWSAAARTGTITHSTLPWREGATLAAPQGWQALSEA